MSILVCQLQGRFGNQVMQYLFARAYAEKHGFELQTESWIGERIFQIDGVRPHRHDMLPIYNEDHLAHMVPAHPFVFRGYAQMASAMIYTKRQAQAWLKLRPEIETACANAILSDGSKSDCVVCHRRAGDYFGYGYPVVSRHSYLQACERFGLTTDPQHFVIRSEENPTPHAGYLPDDLSFMADFYRMMVAPTLLRGNSSFSWPACDFD